MIIIFDVTTMFYENICEIKMFGNAIVFCGGSGRFFMRWGEITTN